ncbi:MAG: helix-turn-helix transcriptional regulator [Calothrix sp. MO_167.B12]|nr:helix-turn-helix transcriptional regulator [Calothrix sp. MO_167.B12]
MTSRCQAIEKVILTIREQLDETLSLQAMAEIANLSPYHFNRVFRQIIGIPPSQFLYALRLEAAKRLLLTTQLSITDVCYEVGYNSLGTFTTRFTKLVGLPPGHLRRLAEQGTSFHRELLCERLASRSAVVPINPGLTGRIKMSEAFAGLIFAGLFLTRIPQSRPVSCTILTAPGLYRMTHIPDGRYYLFVAALPWSDNSSTSLLQEPVLRGSVGPVEIYNGQACGSVDVMLQPKELTDPPILTALPFLLTQHLATESATPRIYHKQ